MAPQIEKSADEHIAALFGDTLHLNPEIARAMRLMYAFGRNDTLEFLGISEEDLPDGEDLVAWSA